ncbi:MAG: AzlD domain-containing protein [Clostridia bacterium]|nr:AzlD domain-containing protein [Clostridia bacterium]
MTNEQIIHSILIVLVCAAVTYLLRGIAFLVFGGKRGTPAFVSWLGNVLPHAVMGMLLVYCLKDVSVTSAPFGLPELFACAVVVLLHVWKRNSLLSIGVGTVSYMVIVALI